jgi:hypothetical protein
MVERKTKVKTMKWFIALFNVKPVYIDGGIAVIIGILGFCLSEMSAEEAYKYWNPYALYFTKFFLGAISAGFVTLNFFRSKSYTDHRKQVEDADSNKVTQTSQTTQIQTNETKTSNPDAAGQPSSL